MKKHICIENKSCICYSAGTEPHIDCPIHNGGGIPRCKWCGKFLKRNKTVLVPSWPWIDEIAADTYNKMYLFPSESYDILKNALMSVHFQTEKSMMIEHHVTTTLKTFPEGEIRWLDDENSIHQ